MPKVSSYNLSLKIIMKGDAEGVTYVHTSIGSFETIVKAKDTLIAISKQFNDQRYVSGSKDNPKTIEVKWDYGLVSLNSYEFLGYILAIDEERDYA